jgi:thioredoxin-like negative regulator of GroEL
MNITVKRFYSSSSSPCSLLSPVFDLLRTRFQGEVQFVDIDVNIDKNESKIYDVRGVPFVVVESSGKKLKQLSGKYDYQYYEQHILESLESI